MTTTTTQGQNDPLLFSLEHTGAGRILFKADDEEQLARYGVSSIEGCMILIVKGGIDKG